MCRVQPSLSPCYLPRNLTPTTPYHPPGHQVIYPPTKSLIQGNLGNGWLSEKPVTYLPPPLLPLSHPKVLPHPKSITPSITPQSITPSITPQSITPSITPQSITPSQVDYPL